MAPSNAPTLPALAPEFSNLVSRPRSSRIFYNNQFYSYPLKPLEALTKLGEDPEGFRRLVDQGRYFPRQLGSSRASK
jgi:hypothetical protein